MAGTLGRIFNRIQCLKHDLLDILRILCRTLLEHSEDILLCLIHDLRRILFSEIAVGLNLRCRLDQTAELRLFLDNLCIVSDIGRGRHRRDQLRQISQ